MVKIGWAAVKEEEGDLGGGEGGRLRVSSLAGGGESLYQKQISVRVVALSLLARYHVRDAERRITIFRSCSESNGNAGVRGMILMMLRRYDKGREQVLTKDPRFPPAATGHRVLQVVGHGADGKSERPTSQRITQIRESPLCFSWIGRGGKSRSWIIRVDRKDPTLGFPSYGEADPIVPDCSVSCSCATSLLIKCHEEAYFQEHQVRKEDSVL
jgi:hypothetical protein